MRKPVNIPYVEHCQLVDMDMAIFQLASCPPLTEQFSHTRGGLVVSSAVEYPIKRQCAPMNNCCSLQYVWVVGTRAMIYTTNTTYNKCREKPGYSITRYVSAYKYTKL